MAFAEVNGQSLEKSEVLDYSRKCNDTEVKSLSLLPSLSHRLIELTRNQHHNILIPPR
jgi:hypothetical protein